jgi:pimeloyl-ACP methyl ester carboxylesterase
MPHLNVNGINIHYQQAGRGPDVVLIHAFTSNMAIWLLTGLVEHLAGEYRVTTYDLRGHGVSEIPPAGYTSAEMVEDLYQLHEALGMGPAYLVGHSFGGVIAMQAAVEHPEMSAGVIVSDTYFPGLKDIEPNIADTAIWKELRQDLLKAHVEIGTTVDFGSLFQIVANLTPEQTEAIRGVMGASATRWLSQLARLAGTTAGVDIFQTAGLTEGRICSIRVPVVGLYDEETTFSATCRYLESHLSDCKIDTVAGARHVAPLQNAPEFARLIKLHLQRMAFGQESKDKRQEPEKLQVDP